MIELLINEKNAGGRLDKLVFKYLDKAPASFVYKMLRKKNIVLNDKKSTGNDILKPGDSVKIYLADDTIAKFRTVQKEIQNSKEIGSLICFEDDNIIALNKPSGMLTQKATGKDFSLNDILVEYLRKENDYFVPGISNRLDRNTSGLVLAGKNLMATRSLNEIIKNRTIKKKYICLVKGKIDREQKERAFLSKDEKKNQVTVNRTKTDEFNEEIVTCFKPLQMTEKYTLLEVDLITGKSHQIRAHLAHLGHPLAGDSKYGDIEFNNYFSAKYGLKSQFLHAYKIEFNNISNNLDYLKGTVIKAPIPENLIKILKGEKLWQPGTAED